MRKIALLCLSASIVILGCDREDPDPATGGTGGATGGAGGETGGAGGETTTGGGAGTGGSGGAMMGCGNGMIEAPEECDGADLGGKSCGSLVPTATGDLACAAGCTIDTSECHCPTGQSVCGAACVDMAADVNNCGACGTTCTTCNAGHCMLALATGLPAGVDVAVNDTTVFWTRTDGTIGSVPKTGGAVGTLAMNQNGAYALAADKTSVYWGNYGGGTIMSAPVDGGVMPTQLYAGAVAPEGLAVTATSVFWTEFNGGKLMKADLDGTSPVVVANGAAPLGIAFDASFVYWTEFFANSIKKTPIGGGATITLATGQAGPWDLAVDASFVYWTNYKNSTVARCGLDGSPPTILATGQGGVRSVLVDATSLYWGSEVPGELIKAGLDGANPVVIATGSISFMAQDATYIYYADSAGTIGRVNKN